ncbi:MAG: Hypothetical protein BHV28_03720 [Candidatus Tokpelaia hoelldobleri]|uniref:DUF1344 domain-containing protein n=1 Tax=Candidatus Tokpelaia hoelldobleri TaxID=1902579 RepID=A0A1U9JTA2_9HYPH|nr:MAG: Hypothetical protein BHV28_03720 [Candidatus Tokpelaia hoelldoblerii]
MTLKAIRKLLSIATFSGLLLPMAAFAGNSQGRIEMIDETANTIILSDGLTYQLPGEFDYSVLSEGMKVLVFYDRDGENRYVTDIEPIDADGKAGIPEE